MLGFRQQGLRILVVYAMQKLVSEPFRGAVIDHSPGRDADDAVSELPGQIDLVQTDYGRDVILGADFFDESQYPLGGRRVKTCDRFVGQHHLGALGDGPGNTHPLLFTPRETVHPLQRLVPHTDPLQRLQSDKLVLLRQGQKTAQSGVIAEAAGKDILQDGPPTNELMLLEDHAGATAMGEEHQALMKTAQPIDNYVSRACNQAIQAAQQGRLAGA